MCKKQTAVSHRSAESEIMSLDAGLRMEGLPAFQFWECVLETFSSKSVKGYLERHKRERVNPSHSDILRLVYSSQLTMLRQQSQQLSFNPTLHPS